MEERRHSLKVPGGEDIPVFTFKGDPGPACFITGGMHGDEINGISLVHLAMGGLREKKINGTIHCIPVLNISGFRQGDRKVPHDGLDLNRCFGVPGDTLSHRIAKVFLEQVVSKCDFGIDCHDSGRNPVLLPHARVHLDNKKGSMDGCSIGYGQVFGSRIVLISKGRSGMLAITSFHDFQVPVLTIEAGGGFGLCDGFLRQARSGINNLLISRGVMKGKMTREKEQFTLEDTDRFAYYSRIQGILHKKIDLGDRIHKGDMIAEIVDPVKGKKVSIVASHCGFVFSLQIHDKIEKGETICSILAERACKQHDTGPRKDEV